MSLLDKARAVPVRGEARPAVDLDELDLALAFLRGEIRHSQVAVALDKSASFVTGWAWRVLAAAVASGAISVTKTPAVKAVAK